MSADGAVLGCCDAMGILSWEEFALVVPGVCSVTLDAKIAGDPIREDANQRQIVEGPPDETQFVIAGPGSGKTTSATLRLLKLVYVDGVDPSGILATTFTRKAAAVLRSRIIGWGEEIRDELTATRPDLASRLELLDLNALRVGTIDSIGQDLLNDYKQAGDDRPSPVEEHALGNLMLRFGVWGTNVRKNSALDGDVTSFLREFSPLNAATDTGRSKLLIDIRQRLLNDRVKRQELSNISNLSSSALSGQAAVFEGIEAFEDELERRQIYDFASISQAFLDALSTPRLDPVKDDLQHLLVDEYQDTNFLQESIYLELAKAAVQNGGGMTVVGDDDQSLYRFRGATVELFAEFENRISNHLGVTPKRITLGRNFRSTSAIVSHVKEFIENDQGFTAARVPGKPSLVHGGANQGRLPVMGIFRDSEEEVANAVGRLLDRLRRGKSIGIKTSAGEDLSLSLDPEKGSPGDVAVLTYSVKEEGQRKKDGSRGRTRFPGHLRQTFDSFSDPISIFNPRGLPLSDIPAVQELLGNLIDCLDPVGAIRELRRSWAPVEAALTEWIDHARQNRPQRNPELSIFVRDWGLRKPSFRTAQSTAVSLNDLIFKLITWLPEFQSDIEHLAWLEAIQRTVASAGVTSGFGGNVIFTPNNPLDDLAATSVKHIYENVLIPIAENRIDVSEDMLETLPPNRVNVLTIHQSKGLEFPIVVVDVGTSLGNLNTIQARMRFPSGPDEVHKMEDHFRQASGIGLTPRDGRDRAFDDLVRNYFVAFSRAQDALIIVGHTNAIQRRSSGTQAKHVASGWTRDGVWPWEGMPHVSLIEDEHL